MTKSKTQSPTTWPFILYICCCCCLPLICCCIFVIGILISDGGKYNSSKLVEGSDADELCIKYDWKFYIGIVVCILQLIWCLYTTSFWRTWYWNNCIQDYNKIHNCIL